MCHIPFCVFQGILHDQDCAVSERAAQVPDLGHCWTGEGQYLKEIVSALFSSTGGPFVFTASAVISYVW